MPYINTEEREQLDMFIADLSTALSDSQDTAGNLNYTVTKLCHSFIDRHGLSYTNVNMLVGMLECAKLELYRRVAAPYETEKVVENGDVLPRELIGPKYHTDVFHFNQRCDK